MTAQHHLDQHIPSFPPQTLQQLRIVFSQIKSGQLNLAIGKRSYSVLEAMLSQPNNVALCNIVDLSKKFNVSPATITRLSKLLGFNGFNSLQNVFKQIDAPNNRFYTESLESLLANKGDDTREYLRSQAQLLCRGLTELVETTSPQTIEQAAHYLSQEKRVFVYGHRQPSAMANMLSYGLTLIRQNVYVFSPGGHGEALAVTQLNHTDMLVLFSFSPYSEITLSIANLAKAQGVKLLVITDSLHSPLVDQAAVSLFVPAIAHFYVNSQILSCFLIENLLNLTAALIGETAMANLSQYEHILKQLNINR
ncbi:MAG: MurR/RpiR family transcriptional regulator [Aestuariibacter sp.]